MVNGTLRKLEPRIAKNVLTDSLGLPYSDDRQNRLSIPIRENQRSLETGIRIRDCMRANPVLLNDHKNSQNG